MPRFIYHGHALAIAGYLRRPVSSSVADHCACVLPSIGGRAGVRSGPYSLSDPETGRPLVSYKEAECSAAGFEIGAGERRTELKVRVRGLNVVDVLRVEEIVAALTIVHTRSGLPEIDSTGSGFTGLSLGGAELVIAIDHELSRAASKYADLRNARKELRENRGCIRHSLARHELLKFDEWDHGYLDHADLGRVYFCEWSAAPYRQGLTMLRLKLGSPAEGELEVAALEADGHDYP